MATKPKAKKTAAKKPAAKKAKASTAKKGAAKASSKADDFRSQSADELSDRIVSLKKEQFNLRFQQANGQLESPGRIRVLRRDIARMQTILTEQRARRAAEA